MSNIRFEPQAKKLAKETGLDKLGQSTLKKLDPDNDGVVRLKDATKLVKAAGLAKDGVLGNDDRKRIKEVLGGASNGKAASSAAPSSAVAAKVGAAKARKLEDGYVELIAKKTSAGVEARVQLTSYDKHGDISNEAKGKLIIANLDAANIEAYHYDAKGKSGNPSASVPQSGVISETSAAGAGAVLVVADKKRGVVLVDVVGAELVAGKAPTQRDMYSLEKLAKDPAVKAAAKKLGLSPTKLSVEVLWADVSHGFVDKALGTLAMELKLKDGNGKTKKHTFSTYLEGTLKKGLGGLAVEKLESGLDRSWGWFYPPSADVGGQKTTNLNKPNDDFGHSNTGVSEHSVTHNTPPPTGGSESSGHIDTGGGE